MKIIRNEYWVFYIDENKHNELDDNKCGKWMYFFNDKEFAKKICKSAVEKDIVVESKHSNDKEGVCCFYLNFDDGARHKKVISFFLENNLIRRTKSGKLYDISFKLDDQTRNMEYGSDFVAIIKLSMFVNLETGEFIK